MRFFSATDNRLARARPPLRPNVFAISDAFMTPLVRSAKHNHKRKRRIAQPRLTPARR